MKPDSPTLALCPLLPIELVHLIDQYVPRKKKMKVSPSMQKQLVKIQNMKLKGKNEMYLRELEDFCLD